MSKLDHITIRSFKSIAAIEELPIAPINVLIGANGSGKSNFLGAFAFLREVREGRLQEYVKRAGGADRILHFGSKTTSEMQFHLSFALPDNKVNGYEITLLSTDSDGLAPGEETPFYQVPPYKRAYGEPIIAHRGEAGISKPKHELRPVPQYVQKCLDSWQFYQFHDTSRTSPMRKSASIHDNRHLHADGGNLAAFLYFLQEKHAERLQFIERVIRLVAPFLQQFILQPARLNEETIRLEWRHTKNNASFDASAFSDGTLRFIALATLLLQPDELRPSPILLDEPELGLHPLAIAKFASMVQYAAARGTQVILATQSPILLDYFSPADVLVAERGGDGQTELTRLKEEPLREWLERYSLGQLWEKNELGGRPAPER